MKKVILFRVNAGGEHGAGHLQRCLVLARLLRKEYDPFFFIKGDHRIGELLYKESFNFKLAMHGYDEQADDIRGLRPNLVFVDMRETPIAFIRALGAFAPVIDLDDIGDGADAADLAVTSLPSVRGRAANLASPQYLVFDPAIADYNKAAYAKKPKKILVSFGGSDPANLSAILVRVSKLLDPSLAWTFVRGSLNQNRWPEGNYQTVQRAASILPHIQEADLVVTSFGMTAYEAAAIGTPVALVNPTAYHEELTEKAGLFQRLGAYRRTTDGDNAPEIAKALQSLLASGDKLAGPAEHARAQVDKQGALRVLDLIKAAIARGKKPDCPVCGQRKERAVLRDAERTIFRCEACGLLAQRYFEMPAFSYEKGYFQEEYQQQYGKTYLEDRLNIDALNAPRLDVIDRLDAGEAKSRQRPAGAPRHLLDIGCAYGFFLDLARDRGWTVQGVEISKAATRYAAQTLALEVQNKAFLDADIEKDSLQAVTMWYVIEHLPQLEQVMEKVYVSLARGGVLAVSTPNARGTSGRWHFADYLAHHPADHFHDFSVPNIRRLLARYRFKVCRVRVTGVHYDRFLGEKRKGTFWDNPFFARCYGFAARALRLGDTFEIYAVKK